VVDTREKKMEGNENPDDEMRSIDESDEEEDRNLIDEGGYRRSFIQGGGDVTYGEDGYEGVGAMEDEDMDLGAYVFSPLAGPNDEVSMEDDAEFSVLPVDEGADEGTEDPDDSEAGEERLQQEVDTILHAKKFESWAVLTQRQQIGGIIEPDVLGSIEVPPAYLKYGRWYTISQSLLALLHCYALLLITIGTIPTAMSLGLFVITTVALVVDIALRVWSYMPRRSKMGIAFDLVTLVASLVVLYSTSAASYQLVFIAVLRGVRLYRIIFMFRDVETFRDLILVYKTVSDSLQSLSILLIFLLVGLFVTSTFIWAAETPDFDSGTLKYNRTCPLEQPCETNKSPFQSIPDAMWLAVNCMTLTGLGDTYPISALGRLVAGCAIILGVFALALPTAVLIGNLEAIRAAAQANDEYRETMLKQQAIEQLIARSLKEFGGSGASSSARSTSALSDPGITLTHPDGENAEDDDDDDMAGVLSMNMSGALEDEEGLEGGDGDAVAAALQAALSIAANKKKKPAVGEFLFMSAKKREVREGSHGDYLYNPFMTIVNDIDGYPLVGNLTAITEASSVVTVFLCLDDPLARELAADSVKSSDAVVHCAHVSDLEVKIVSTEGSVVLYRNPGGGEIGDCYVPLVFLVGQPADKVDLVREELVGTKLLVEYSPHSYSSLVWHKTFQITSEEFRESRFITTLMKIAVAVSPDIFNDPNHATENDEQNQDDEVLKKRRSVAFIHPDYIQELFESVDDFFDLPPHTTIRNVYEVVQDITAMIVSHSREIFAKDIPPLLTQSVYDADHVTMDDRLLEIDIDYFRCSDWPFGGVAVELVTCAKRRKVPVKIGDGDSSEGPQPVLGPRLATLRNGYSLAFQEEEENQAEAG
jgi:voltage-gated potassium channel